MEKLQKLPTPFSEDQLIYFKNLLLDKREEAVHEIEKLNESMADISADEDEYSSATSAQLDDISADAEERQLNYKLQERTRSYIKQIDAALERIKNGSYGICLATGKAIPEERLKIVPHTRYSLEAKKLGLNEIGDQY
ncbi:TraR/DksA family transcriptional regulator [Balneola sp. MJW-20]|uniref:TraR/DksA family transcriptional regulator n=1 Tax=Gracilimonas aurantiaca TaxID=3234185 RepID=UPI003467B41D